VGWSITSNANHRGAFMSIRGPVSRAAEIYCPKVRILLLGTCERRRKAINSGSRVLGLKAQDRTVELIHFLKEVVRTLVKTYESRSFVNHPIEKLQLELKAQGRTNDWIDFLKEVGANASGFDCSRRLHRSRRVSLFRNHESKQYRQSGSPKPVGPCLVGP
jgi:hypothetical protein